MLFIVIGNIATNTATDSGSYDLVIKVQSSTPKLPYRGAGVILAVINHPSWELVKCILLWVVLLLCLSTLIYLESF